MSASDRMNEAIHYGMSVPLRSQFRHSERSRVAGWKWGIKKGRRRALRRLGLAIIREETQS